jgi:hypothetical protein
MMFKNMGTMGYNYSNLYVTEENYAYRNGFVNSGSADSRGKELGVGIHMDGETDITLIRDQVKALRDFLNGMLGEEGVTAPYELVDCINVNS